MRENSEQVGGTNNGERRKRKTKIIIKNNEQINLIHSN